MSRHGKESENEPAQHGKEPENEPARQGKEPENEPAPSSSNSRKYDDDDCLDLSKSVIDSKDSKVKARKLESGHLPKLKVLFLHGNAGDLGMRAMLNALRAGHLKKLEQLILLEVSSYDQLTTAEEGTDTIAEALRAGKVPELVLMDVTGSLPKLIPRRKPSTVIKDLFCKRSCGEGRMSQVNAICLGCLYARGLEKGKDQTIECFRCVFGKLEIYSGDDGIEKIVGALKSRPITTLETLLLQENHIGDKGAEEVAELLRSGVLPNLKLVDMRNNPVGYEGAKKLVRAFLDNPLLTVSVKLDWPSWLLEQKAVAFRENNIRLEHMMKEYKISPEKLVVNFKDQKFKYFVEELLEWKQKGLFCKIRFATKLRLLCQAQYEHYRDKEFKDHHLHEALHVGGIDVRRIKQNDSCFDISLNKQFVDTEHSEANKEHSQALERSGVEVVKHYKAARAVHSVYCNVVDISGLWIPKCWRDWANRRQEKQMETIKQELLMLAESKPDHFYKLFRLRQVLLKNPSQGNKYSRVWICDSCFQQYGPNPEGICSWNSAESCDIYPITTAAELNPGFHYSTGNDSAH